MATFLTLCVCMCVCVCICVCACVCVSLSLCVSVIIVDDGNFPHLAAITSLCVARCYRNVVKDTEAHSLVRLSMVTGRPDERVRVLRSPRHDLVHTHERAADRLQDDVDAVGRCHAFLAYDAALEFEGHDVLIVLPRVALEDHFDHLQQINPGRHLLGVGVITCFVRIE